MKNKVGRPKKTEVTISYVIEDGITPVNSSPIKETPEYKVMEKMKVNQSVSYPPTKRGTFDYARNAYHKETVKRFIIRTIDKRTLRVFRIADGEMGKTRKPHYA